MSGKGKMWLLLFIFVTVCFVWDKGFVALFDDFCTIWPLLLFFVIYLVGQCQRK